MTVKFYRDSRWQLLYPINPLNIFGLSVFHIIDIGVY